jgi:hypothetical protein
LDSIGMEGDADGTPRYPCLVFCYRLDFEIFEGLKKIYLSCVPSESSLFYFYVHIYDFIFWGWGFGKGHEQEFRQLSCTDFRSSPRISAR